MRDAPRHAKPIDHLVPAEERGSLPAAVPVAPLPQVLARLEALLERALGAEPGAATGLARPTVQEGDAWREPALSEAVLQELRLMVPRSGPGSVHTVMSGQVEALDPGLLLTEGTRLSFDTFFNSFYEHYWAGHAPVGALSLRLFGTGEVLVDVFRALPDGSSYRIGGQRLRLDPHYGAAASVALAASPAGAGRIFFEIAAMTPAVIRAGRLETATPPVRPVRFGIALCTFNREAMLVGNLQRLLQSSYDDWASPRIVVVNQGAPFASEAMRSLLASRPGRIEVVEQANLGGAGGFTRAAMEILRDDRCSHVLFMDDDIEFDPAVLTTTHAFAARAVVTTVIGGAMLDLFRPNRIYEAGAVIDPLNIIRAVHHECRIDQAEKLHDFAREVPCHFNGWWYCAIPAPLFRQHGLPLPVFIRGDDMEYGTRLMSRGVPTVSLPPVSVWHEPFYAKPPGWQLYYDLRNRLIFAACYDSLVRQDRTIVILRRLIDSLLKHDYMHAELVIRAVEDFLAGPAVLDVPMDALHRDILALTAAHAPERRPSTLGMMPAAWRKPPRFGWRQATLAAGLAALLLGRVRGGIRPDQIFRDQWHPWMTMRRSQYGLTDRMHSYVQLYRYDRTRLRDCLRRGLRTVWRYHRQAGGIAPRWRAAQEALAAWPRWERILGLRPPA